MLNTQKTITKAPIIISTKFESRDFLLLLIKPFVCVGLRCEINILIKVNPNMVTNIDDKASSRASIFKSSISSFWILARTLPNEAAVKINIMSGLNFAYIS